MLRRCWPLHRSALRLYSALAREAGASASGEPEAWSHTPVLVKECLKALGVDRPTRQPRHFLDMTFGCGGHTEAILRFAFCSLVCL